jgi:hypothetical protein
MEEPHRLADSYQEMNTKKRRTNWAQEIIQDVEKYGSLDVSFR